MAACRGGRTTTAEQRRECASEGAREPEPEPREDTAGRACVCGGAASRGVVAVHPKTVAHAARPHDDDDDAACCSGSSRMSYVWRREGCCNRKSSPLFYLYTIPQPPLPKQPPKLRLHVPYACRSDAELSTSFFLFLFIPLFCMPSLHYFHITWTSGYFFFYFFPLTGLTPVHIVKYATYGENRNWWDKYLATWLFSSPATAFACCMAGKGREKKMWRE